MKNFISLVCLLIFINFSYAQIVDIPDANLKAQLITLLCADINGDGEYTTDVDTNDDGEIQVLEAQSVLGLYLPGQSSSMPDFQSLDGMEAFVNLLSLDISYQDVTQYDSGMFPQMIELNLYYNLWQSVDFTQNVNLEKLNFNAYQVNEIDLSQNINLLDLKLSYLLGNVDLSQNINLTHLIVTTYINYYSGVNGMSSLDITNLVNLEELSIGFNTTESSVNFSPVDFTQNINLRKLNLTNYYVDYIDLSQNVNLTHFDSYSVSNTSFNNFDLSNNINLEELSLFRKRVGDLDLSSNVNLKKLSIESSNTTNQITIPQNSILEYVNINLMYNLSSLNLNQASNLKHLELGYSPVASIDLSNLINLEYLKIANCDITSLNLLNLSSLDYLNLKSLDIDSVDITDSTELSQLFLTSLDLSELDLSQQSNLEYIDISGNKISTLDVENNPSLVYLNISNNNIQSLDFNAFTNLVSIQCNNNEFTSIDVRNTKVKYLYCNNNNLEELILKNGVVSTSTLPPEPTPDIGFGGNPNLSYICVDAGEYNMVNYFSSFIGDDVIVDQYCTFLAGDSNYIIEGENILDIDANGCDLNDLRIPFFKYDITDGNNESVIFSDAFGYYFFPLPEGEHAITPVLENASYFVSNPTTLIVDYPTDVSPTYQDFCITSTGLKNDLEVVLIPLGQPMPGFDSSYKIIYKNVGSTTQSGAVTFDFSLYSDYLTYLSSNPSENSSTGGLISWNYSNLQPFEEREIILAFSLNTPTDTNSPLNSGDQISFEASINSGETDETPENNVFSLNQTIVNSYDPNSIECLEGESILPLRVGEYVHYLIRFENSGTANATNIMVEDTVDETKFDISTLVPINGSHNYYTRIDDDNIVKFIFENINLPFDDANNDGYVVFKIKTLETLVLGDEFANQAEIYFDFNAPIITNNYTTEVADDNLSINDYENGEFGLYPNPTSNSITITSNSNIEQISVLDINGRVINMITINEQKPQYSIDVENLTSGVYFLQLQSSTSNKTLKFVKQ